MIPFTSIIRNANRSWSFAWTSTGSIFYRIVLNGLELDQVTSPTYVWRGNTYGTYPPPLEIADEDEKVLSETYFPYLIIQWYGEPGARNYLVQKHDPTWFTVAQFQEAGLWVYTYRTVLLTDETEYDYRVVAVDSMNNESQPQMYHKYMVCPPVPPDGIIVIDYDKPNIRVSAV